MGGVSDTSLLIVFSIFAMAVAFLWGSYKRTKQKKQWQALAEGLGLDWFEDHETLLGRITGEWKGLRVHISCVKKDSDNSEPYTSILTYHPKPLAMGFSIKREHLLHSISKKLGSQDLQTGDKAFDDRFLVKGRRSDDVLRLLNAKTRKLMLSYDEHTTPLHIDDEAITYKEQKLILEKAPIQTVLNHQNTIIKALIESSSALEEERHAYAPALAQEHNSH